MPRCWRRWCRSRTRWRWRQGRGCAGSRTAWCGAWGSAAFIAGSAWAGLAIGWGGLGVIIGLNAALLAVAAGFAWRLPDRRGRARPGAGGSLLAVLAVPVFRRVMIVAALIGGSHAMHDGFEVIRWRAAGMGTDAAGLLWSESVAAEVLVFFVLGPRLIARLGLHGAAMLAGAAGVVRWGVAAQTAAVPAMALVEPLHGLTFALLHLVCVQTIAQVVPERLAATAQAFYGTVAVGAASTALTFASGPLYGRLGASAFWVMAGLCAAAIPLARGLRVPARQPIGALGVE